MSIYEQFILKKKCVALSFFCILTRAKRKISFFRKRDSLFFSDFHMNNFDRSINSLFSWLSLFVL